MNHSMITAMASMSGLQRRIDMIADNLANVNTAGYKRKEAVFEDLLTSVRAQQSDFVRPGRTTPPGFVQGWGAYLSGIRNDFAPGAIQATGNPLDLAIEGNGLLEVSAGGTTAWTRGGALKPGAMNGAWVLTTQDGYPVLDVNDRPIRIPEGYEIIIDETGLVTGSAMRGAERVNVYLGQIKLMEAVRPDLLQRNGDGLYVLPTGADPGDESIVRMAAPGSGIRVRQGHLEQSNVDLAVEMTDLISVQRAYQLNARALSSSDTMMSLANNLRS
jgi:flagellar basal-body rod protein FlgG